MDIFKDFINNEKNYTQVDNLIVKSIITDPYSILNLKIDDFAEQCFTTKASVVKTLQKFGINGYKDLKNKIANQLMSSKGNDFNCSKDCQNTINNLLSTDLLLKDNKKDLNLLIKKIENAERISLVAGGAISYVAKIMSDQLNKLGKNSKVYDVEASNFWSNEKDLIIFISNSGVNNRIYKKCEYIYKNQESKIFIVSITAANTTNIKSFVNLHIPGSRLFSVTKKEYHFPSTSISVIWFIIQNIIKKFYEFSKEDNDKKINYL